MAITSLVALESPWSHEFDSPRVEMRRLLSEFVGTFFLVLVGAGGAVVDAASGGQIGRAAGGGGAGPPGPAGDLVLGRRAGGPPHPGGALALPPPGGLP